MLRSASGGARGLLRMATDVVEVLRDALLRRQDSSPGCTGPTHSSITPWQWRKIEVAGAGESLTLGLGGRVQGQAQWSRITIPLYLCNPR